jgi:hypothetical protein
MYILRNIDIFYTKALLLLKKIVMQNTKKMVKITPILPPKISAIITLQLNLAEFNIFCNITT